MQALHGNDSRGETPSPSLKIELIVIAPRERDPHTASQHAIIIHISGRPERSRALGETPRRAASEEGAQRLLQPSTRAPKLGKAQRRAEMCLRQ